MERPSRTTFVLKPSDKGPLRGAKERVQRAIFADNIGVRVIDPDTLVTSNGMTHRIVGGDGPETGFLGADIGQNILGLLTLGQPLIYKKVPGKDAKGRELNRICVQNKMVYHWFQGLLPPQMRDANTGRVNPNYEVDTMQVLIALGLAYVDPRYEKSVPENKMIENWARKCNRGLWKLPDGGYRPYDWRNAKDIAQNCQGNKQILSTIKVKVLEYKEMLWDDYQRLQQALKQARASAL